MTQSEMTVQRTQPAKPAAKGKTSRPKTVTYGSVTVQVIPATKGEARENVKAGQVAMGKLLQRIQTPGVRLSLRKGVPVYYADPKDPTRLIRRVHGKTQRVRFAHGDFVVCE